MFWRWFLGIAALPSAVVAFAYKLLPESPRFLHVMERHDEALEVKRDRYASKPLGAVVIVASNSPGQR